MGLPWPQAITAGSLMGTKTVLNELIAWTAREGFHGVLRRVGLQDVIQMECLGRNSSVLEIHNQRVRGRIYIEDGKIVHAVAGNETGEGAFQKLLALSSGEFHLQPFESPPKRTLEGQWEFLLMEAARVRDEVASLPPASEPDEELPSVPATGVSAAAAELPPHVAETLICSGQGAALYTWQCPNVNARVALLRQIAQKAMELGELLPLGNFERLEIQLSDSRAIAQDGDAVRQFQHLVQLVRNVNAGDAASAQVQPDRMVFVRVASDENPQLKRR